MVFEDKEKDELRRVVGAKWHSDRKEVNAGWALETMLADSHTERELYHVLSVRDDADDDDEEDWVSRHTTTSSTASSLSTTTTGLLSPRLN